MVMIAGAVVIYFSLVPSPRLVGLPEPSENTSEHSRQRHASDEDKDAGPRQAISVGRALCLPGVMPVSESVSNCKSTSFAQYSLAYACLKLVNYSFFFWLPYYLSSKFGWEEAVADRLSTWYDWGGIVGGLIAGVVTVCTLRERCFHSFSPGSLGVAHSNHRGNALRCVRLAARV